MFWINIKTKEQTTDETTVAQWLKNNDEIDVFTWCGVAGTFVRARYN